MRAFSFAHRAAEVADATSGVLDVLVVGLGATGAGVALDAASRGLSVAAIDRGDLASGTSSKSSKLIHGGLRYLENYDFGLVYEGVTERELLQRLAPHLVRPMDFVYPILPDTAKARLVGLGLTTYDVLAGVRNVRRHERLDAAEAVALAPALASSGLQRAYVYGDCATDDARLVLAVVTAARRFGALALTYTAAERLLLDGAGRVCGVAVRDTLGGAAFEIRARHVVNATGVWVDTLLAQESPDGGSHVVQPSKGVHLVVPRERVPLTGAAILMPSRQGDGRSMFAIPWGRQTILGTTDTAYDGPLDVVGIDAADVDYVLAAANALFDAALHLDDVVGGWAGCRPLLRGTSESMSDLSRRHALSEGPSGLLTITGGKLTTYRRMAKDVVDRIAARDDRHARCRTDEIPLGCARPFEAVLADVTAAAAAVGVDGETAETLVRQHGEAAADVLALTADDPALAAPLSPAAAHVAAEVVHAARHEGAATLDDVFARRTRLALRARDAALPAALGAARLLARETGRDDAWAAGEVAAYEAAVRRERGVLPLG
ncbi:MAG TPA: glycerol-3-phosphate dehydrogenase/oxidase [Mycobacteriales bacterium]|nr:glycerol-3-phosphate dehydrogenase/oxidase [Mycobacteriales bacterium]